MYTSQVLANSCKYCCNSINNSYVYSLSCRIATSVYEVPSEWRMAHIKATPFWRVNMKRLWRTR